MRRAHLNWPSACDQRGSSLGSRSSGLCAPGRVGGSAVTSKHCNGVAAMRGAARAPAGLGGGVGRHRRATPACAPGWACASVEDTPGAPCVATRRTRSMRRCGVPPRHPAPLLPPPAHAAGALHVGLWHGAALYFDLAVQAGEQAARDVMAVSALRRHGCDSAAPRQAVCAVRAAHSVRGVLKLASGTEATLRAAPGSGCRAGEPRQPAGQSRDFQPCGLPDSVMNMKCRSSQPSISWESAR